MLTAADESQLESKKMIPSKSANPLKTAFLAGVSFIIIHIPGYGAPAAVTSFSEDYASGPPGDALIIRNRSGGGEQIVRVTVSLIGSNGRCLIDPLDPNYPVFPSVEGADIVGAKDVPCADGVGATYLCFGSPVQFSPRPGIEPQRSGFRSVQIEFNDFDPGESFTINMDADSNLGLDSRVEGRDWAGSRVVIEYASGVTQAAAFSQAGEVTAGALTPDPDFSLSGDGDQVTLTWEGPWILKTSTELKEWVTVEGSFSPYVFTMHPGSRFWRLEEQ